MTTTTKRRDRAAVQHEIDELAEVEYLVSTNDGTYGASEARRKVGCGDPVFATRRVYETVGGARRETGPDERSAPGRMREINRVTLAADRARLSELRRELRALR